MEQGGPAKLNAAEATKLWGKRRASGREALPLRCVDDSRHKQGATDTIYSFICIHSDNSY